MHSNLERYAKMVGVYARQHHVGQTSTQLGIRDKLGRFIKVRWIPQNQIPQIIDGLDIPITQEQLEELLQD